MAKMLFLTSVTRKSILTRVTDLIVILGIQQATVNQNE